MAGINAHNKVKEKEPFILKRSEAYIGVLIDDLVNKGTQEPYRMFTSRAEYRILLRQDNADLRLTEKSHQLGLASDERLQKVKKKKEAIASLSKELSEMRAVPIVVNEALALLESATITEKVPVVNLLRRPHIGMSELKKIDKQIEERLSKYSEEIQQQVEVALKYESYIEREQKLAEKIESLEYYTIKPDFDYDRVKALSSEAREKLKRIRPETIGQMSRISGVSPADVSILTVYLGK
jgi:tRNA uridine 5-carboxymethylaminomethyl modification enzyme